MTLKKLTLIIPINATTLAARFNNGNTKRFLPLPTTALQPDSFLLLTNKGVITLKLISETLTREGHL